MTRKPQIGDRFKDPTLIWEVVDDVRFVDRHFWTYTCKILSGGSEPDIIRENWYTDSHDEYLGNFNKMSNFDVLYNLLNS